MYSTVEALDDPPRIYINLSGINANARSLEVFRIIEGNYSSLPYDSMKVRGTNRALVGTTAFLMDWDAPVGVKISYQIKAYGANGVVVETDSTLPTIIPASGEMDSLAWMSDPLAPNEAVQVNLLADTDTTREYPASVQVVTPAGTPYGVANIGARLAPIMHIEVCTRGDEVDTMERLIMEAPTLLIRPPSGTRMPALFYGAPDQVTRTNVGSRRPGREMHVHWAWDMQQTRGPGRALLVAVWSYRDTKTALGTTNTYKGAPTVFATYRDRVRGRDE